MKNKEFKEVLFINRFKLILSIAFALSFILLIKSSFHLITIALLFIIIFIAVIIKVSIHKNNKTKKIEHRFCYELVSNLSSGYHLSDSYFYSSKVLQFYNLPLYTLDEIRVNNDLIEEYDFSNYHDVLKSLLCEDDFYHLNSNKYTLFTKRVIEQEEINSKINSMIGLFDFIGAIILCLITLTNILIFIFERKLIISDVYIIICLVIDILYLFCGECYEKIKCKG